MNQLIAFIKSHAIDVVSHTSDTITCVAVYSKGGAAFTQTEIVDANWNSVRNWLGY